MRPERPACAVPADLLAAADMLAVEVERADTARHGPFESGFISAAVA